MSESFTRKLEEEEEKRLHCKYVKVKVLLRSVLYAPCRLTELVLSKNQYVYICRVKKGRRAMQKKPPAARTAAVRMPDQDGKANSKVHREKRSVAIRREVV